MPGRDEIIFALPGGLLTLRCLWCGNPLSGHRRKYCSRSCKMKYWRKMHPGYDEKYQYRRNKYVKKPGDDRDTFGSNNPNWKDGVSKDNYRYSIRFKNKNPEKFKVHKIVWSAIKNKKLDRMPCVICGRKDAHAHHEDYSKPFDIVWLCQLHHNQYHSGKIRLPEDAIPGIFCSEESI